jgi:hypothetical protein
MSTSRIPGRRLTGVLISVGLAVLLTACASGDKHPGGTGKDDVASLPSGGATTSASDKPTAQERPLIRSDSSREEQQRLEDEYERCLKEHGHPQLQNREPGNGPRVSRHGPDNPPEAVAAEKACANKEPERASERARRIDPKYADKLRDWVTCIRAHGIDAWESDGNLMFNSLPPDDQMQKVHECEDKAFGTG